LDYNGPVAAGKPAWLLVVLCDMARFHPYNKWGRKGAKSSQAMNAENFLVQASSADRDPSNFQEKTFLVIDDVVNIELPLNVPKDAGVYIVNACNSEVRCPRTKVFP
jgi:hypothetical protein